MKTKINKTNGALVCLRGCGTDHVTDRVENTNFRVFQEKRDENRKKGFISPILHINVTYTPIFVKIGKATSENGGKEKR